MISLPVVQNGEKIPFHFRIYFVAIGAKGHSAHVLMIDVARPSIDKAMHFFQLWFNGTKPNSLNDIPYMYWPLYKKSYDDVDRLKIILDHHQFVGTDSVVALKGLHPLDTLVKLVNGVHTSIRRLLLSVPAQGTTTGKLFVQIKRKLTSEWLLCCFDTQDASKVTARLNTLEDSLKRVTHPDSHHHLFLSPAGLSYNGQAAPLIKG